MVIDDELLLAIDAKINLVGAEYAQVQGLILTEDDLKCKLYSELIQIPSLTKPCVTTDSWVKASKVHAEASWFGLLGELNIRPDLTIFDPINLSVLRSLQPHFKFRSKGFHVLGNAIIFELKFIRWQNGMTERDIDNVRKDVNKIKELYQKMEEESSPYSLTCYIVIFSKVACKHNDLVEDFHEEMSNDNRFRVFYHTGNVSFHKP